MPRRRCVAALLSALLAVVAVAGVGLLRPWVAADVARESPAAVVPLTSQGSWPAGLHEAAQSAIATDAYTFAARPDGTWATSTPAQNLRSTFGPAGPSVGPVGGGWELNFSLARIGRPGALVAVPGAQIAGTAEGVQYRRGPGLTEWYRNEARGLEQGFTLASSPSGGEGPLVLEMDAAGLTVALSADGDAVVGSTPDATPVLRYSGLQVNDATGRDVPASLAVQGQAVQLRVEDAGATYPLTIDPWFQQAQLTASDAAANDEFGFSVAVSGDTAVVGAPGHDSAAGSAYVFVHSGGTWTEQQQLTASDAAANDLFGVSVAIAGDTVVVGAYTDDAPASANAGSAYVFVRSGGTWTQQQKLTAPDAAAFDLFGVSVAVSGDTVVAGVYTDDTAAGTDTGSAYVFVRSGGTWTQQQKLTASDAAANDLFGISVAISGDTIVAGAHLHDTPTGQQAGSAYVFVRSGGTWTEQQKLTAFDGAVNDVFGISVAASGDTVAVGAYSDDTPAGTSAGSAYVFVRSGGTWTQQQKLTASDAAAGDLFGISVAISGDTVVAGAYGDDTPAGTDAGSAYVFVRSGGTWTEQQKLTASDAAGDDLFGVSVAVSGDTVVAGAWFDTTPAGESAGSAYVFAIGCAGVAATVEGSSGDDVLTGTAGPDVIAGLGGNDTITGLGGNDIICGGSGDDDIDGGAGSDDINGESGIDTLNGGDDPDVLTGGAGNDALHGGAGNDTLDGSSGADTLNGDTGDDLVSYAKRATTVIASIGDGANDGAVGETDTIQGDVENLRGGAANDTLTGDSAANRLYGEGGGDTLNGAGGADILKGQAGNDTVNGDAGNDTLFGGEHDDALHGGADNDTLTGDSGADTLAGNSGTDSADYTTRSVPIIASIGGGADDGATGENDDIAGDIENLRGGSNDDVLSGDANANRLYGNAGHDTLTGNAGNDLLYGDAGNDTIDALDGQSYIDGLYCGAGADSTTTDTRDRTTADCE